MFRPSQKCPSRKAGISVRHAGRSRIKLHELSLRGRGPSATFGRAIGASAHGGKADVSATFYDVAVSPKPDSGGKAGCKMTSHPPCRLPANSVSWMGGPGSWGSDVIRSIEA